MLSSRPLRSSNGQADQVFELSRSPALRDTVEMYVDDGGGEVQWTNVSALGDNLLTSGPKDKEFEVEQNALGVVTVKTGDGTRGKIPTLGTDNIRFEYRVNADDNGNVGSGTIIVNSEGSSFVKTVTNPRPANGWAVAEGSTDESLALVKEQGPASLRTLNRACSPSDYEDLALSFETSAGTRPIVRAQAIEEYFGVKTIGLIVVGTDGNRINADTRDELEEYFNGNDALGTEGVGMINQEVTVINFTPRTFGLTVTIEADESLTEELVKTTVVTLLNPTAQDSSGNYIWKWQGRVPLSRIASEIFQISPGSIYDVDIYSPSADLELADEELPLVDTTSITVNIVQPT